MRENQKAILHGDHEFPVYFQGGRVEAARKAWQDFVSLTNHKILCVTILQLIKLHLVLMFLVTFRIDASKIAPCCPHNVNE